MKISVAELTNLTRKALAHYGYDENEIEVISEVLLYAQLRGNNQGVVKLIGKGLPKDVRAGEMKIERETKLSALLNGNHNQGMVVMKKALGMVLAKAKEHGFGIVGTNHTASSTGAIGYYAEQIARQGYIGWVFAGSPPTVTTHGSYEALFGTNPLAIGIPTKGEPLVLDMATSAMAYFGLVQAKTAGQTIPGDVAYDSEGNLTTDPAKGMEGAIRPFDRSHKGAGLGLMVEVLTGPLVGASFVGLGGNQDWGNLLYVMDPELLVDREKFISETTQLVERVKNAKRLEGVEEIFLPGERGNRLAAQHLKTGQIEVEDNLLAGLRQVAGKV
ncbi:MAG TPA: Ldh family oxidoreductase [Vitreimonas sp.]|nr:Ldh family oxidoreductase [Vitreimonas sp.]